MSIDRLALDVRKGIEREEDDVLEVPVKLLFQILFSGRPADQNTLHKKLLEMKTKYNDIDYLGVLSRNNPIIRFYKKPEDKTKLLKGESDNGGNENDSG